MKMSLKIFVFVVTVGLGAAASIGLRRIHELPDNVSLLDLDTASIDHLISYQDDVDLFTECFLDLQSCKSKPSRSLIKEILSLKFGGECPTCTKEEQDLLHTNILHFIEQFSTKYRSHWRRVLPHLGFLLVKS